MLPVKWIIILLAGLSCTLALGTQTSIENYPSLVQLELSTSSFWLQQCVGSVITNVHILSAGSCLRGALSWYRIRCGASMRGVGGVVHSVQHIIRHPNSILPRDISDIGLIRLTWGLTFGPTIAQALIMPEGFLLPQNMPVESVGWGSTTFQQEGGIVINDYLHSLQLQTKNFNACEEAYSSYPGERPGNVSVNTLCVGLSTAEGRDFDSIDTGAPVFFGNIVAGVVSFGIERADDMMPIVATEIAHYTNWIVANAV